MGGFFLRLASYRARRGAATQNFGAAGARPTLSRALALSYNSTQTPRDIS
jgi:hypothetical protein